MRQPAERRLMLSDWVASRLENNNFSIVRMPGCLPDGFMTNFSRACPVWLIDGNPDSDLSCDD